MYVYMYVYMDVYTHRYAPLPRAAFAPPSGGAGAPTVRKPYTLNLRP